MPNENSTPRVVKKAAFALPGSQDWLRKTWYIFRHEYRRHVFQRRFIFGLLSLPMVLALMGIVILLLLRSELAGAAIGYVDQGGFLSQPYQPIDEPLAGKITFLSYASEPAASQALSNGQIQAYYVLAADYAISSKAQLVYYKRPNSYIQGTFEDWVITNLLQDRPPQVVERLTQGSEMVISTLDGKRQFAEDAWFTILLPVATSLMLIMTLLTSAGYLMQAVVEEKENRTMEVVVTSVSPVQLMTGKTLADMAIGLTQVLSWVALISLLVWIGSGYFDWLQKLQIDWGMIGLAGLVFVPALVMFSALMALVGATVTEAREAQQVAGLFTLPMWIPFVFMSSLMSSPNSPLAVGLSLFPLSAPISLLMRAGFTEVPAWQIGVSLTLLVLAALGSVWAAGQAFRLGMLSYGKRIPLKDILRTMGSSVTRKPRQEKAA